MKRIFPLFAILLLALALPAYAATPYALKAQPYLSFDGTTARCSVTFTGNDSTDEADLTLTLYQGNTFVDSWSASGTPPWIKTYVRERSFSMKRKRWALLLVFALILTSATPAYATSPAEPDSEIEYAETRRQVNFGDLNIFVVDGTSVEVSPKEGMSTWSNRSANSDVQYLNHIFDEFPGMEAGIAAEMQNIESGELAAIAFTEVPLKYVDDHYERMTVAEVTNADSDDSGFTGEKGKFTLSTSVYRSVIQNSDGSYNYTSTTRGEWSENSFVGGSDYPASEDDYVWQTTPNDWFRNSHEMSASFDSSPVKGEEGSDFWCTDGDERYLEYVICDDPFGWRQNKRFSLSCESEAYESNNRMIRSYYVHTWKAVTIDVSIGVNNKREVTLNIDPGLSSRSWKVHGYVIFDF